MVDEIKLDKTYHYQIDSRTPAGSKQTGSSQEQEVVPMEDVTVSGQLAGLIQHLSVNEHANEAHLNDIKTRINQNQYAVDLDQLTDRLLNSGILNKIG